MLPYGRKTPAARLMEYCAAGVVFRKAGDLLAVVDAGDFGPEGIQTAVDVLVAAVDLVDVLDGRDPFGRHGRDQQRHARTDVGRGHAGRAQA